MRPASAASAQRLRDTVFILLAYLVVPNVPFLILGLLLPEKRAPISLDYLLVGLFAVLLGLRRRWVLMILVPIFVLDLFRAFAGIYYFDFINALTHLGDLIYVSPSLTVPRAAMVLGGAILVSGIAVLTARRSSRAGVRGALALLLVIVLAQVILSLGMGRHYSLAQSTVGSSFLDEYAYLRSAGNDFPPQIHSLGRSFIPGWAASGDPRSQHIVEVLMESLGQSIPPQWTDAVLSPLDSPQVQARYYIQRGVVGFTGGTLNGEIREMCGWEYQPAQFKKSNSSSFHLLEGCIPNLLRGYGYQTIGMNSFSGFEGERTYWYPRLGFQQIVFRENPAHSMTEWTQCGDAFVGSCDPKVAQELDEQLRKGAGEKQFIYWVTINSHMPVSDHTAATSTLDCRALPGILDVPGACNVAKVQYETNQAIAKVVLDPSIPPTTFLLVGDHAPPILSAGRGKVYDQHNVPYIVLIPKIPGAGPPPAVRP